MEMPWDADAAELLSRMFRHTRKYGVKGRIKENAVITDVFKDKQHFFLRRGRNTTIEEGIPYLGQVGIIVDEIAGCPLSLLMSDDAIVDVRSLPQDVEILDV